MNKQQLLIQSPEINDWFEENFAAFRELMAYYRCAMMEIETKFNVLNEQLSLQYDRNPIEAIKVRLKRPDSIVEKLQRRGHCLSMDNIERNIFDIAGIRIICSFPEDIYMLAESLLGQDDVRLVERKDYIANPKSNGYRSLHLIVELPIFLHKEKRLMKVEVQLRTIAMDWWASLEHKIRYKKDIPDHEAISAELKACADISAQLDRRMDAVRLKIEQSNTIPCKI